MTVILSHIKVNATFTLLNLSVGRSFSKPIKALPKIQDGLRLCFFFLFMQQLHLLFSFLSEGVKLVRGAPLLKVKIEIINNNSARRAGWQIEAGSCRS